MMVSLKELQQYKKLKIIPTERRESVDTPMRNPVASASGKTPMHEGPDSETYSFPPSAASRHMNASEIDLNSPLNYGTPSSIGSIRTPHSGIQNTPLKMRPDIRGVGRHLRQVQLDSISEVDAQSEAG